MLFKEAPNQPLGAATVESLECVLVNGVPPEASATAARTLAGSACASGSCSFSILCLHLAILAQFLCLTLGPAQPHIAISAYPRFLNTSSVDTLDQQSGGGGCSCALQDI